MGGVDIAGVLRLGCVAKLREIWGTQAYGGRFSGSEVVPRLVSLANAQENPSLHQKSLWFLLQWV